MNAATMRAVRLTEWESDPVLTDVPVPEPRGSEVLIEVGAAGLCRSDLHIMGSAPGAFPYELPFTLGHETAGRVAALGPGASGVEVGDRVVVYSRWGCGTCWQCANGRDNACAHTSLGPHGAGLGRDGGLAEYVIVPSARYLVPAAGLDPVAAAPLSDAALTSYHAAKLSIAQLRPGTTAVVLGVGGLGHLAIQILKAISPVRIVAVDVRSAALELARNAGADAVLSADGLTPEAVRAETGPGERPSRSTSSATMRRLRSPRGRSGRAGTSRSWAGVGASSAWRRDGFRTSAPCECRRGGRWPSSPRWWRWPPPARFIPRPRCLASTRCSAPTAGCGTGTCSDARSSSRAAVN